MLEKTRLPTAMAYEDVTIALPVRPNDLDSFGHVNYAVFLEYMEAGRWAWLSHNYGRLQPKRILPVVARLEISYQRELRMAEQALVTTRLEEADQSAYSVFFRQFVQVHREGRTITCVEARVQMVFMDGVNRSLSSLQAYLADV